jgi:hypothetical protein
MKKYWGVEVQLHAFLISALDGSVWSVSCPGRFSPRKDPRYTLDGRLDGPQTPSGRGGEEKKRSPNCPWQVSNPGRSAGRLVTILIELPRLRI